MPILVSCVCGKQFRVADDLAGKRLKCPACGHVQVAQPPEEPAASAELPVAAAPAPRWALRGGLILGGFAVLLVLGLGGGLLIGALLMASRDSAPATRMAAALPPTNAATQMPTVVVAPPATKPSGAMSPAEERAAQRLQQAKMHFEQGLAARDRKDHDAAILAFTEALRLVPDDAAAYTWRGVCHFRKGDCQTARADLDRAIELDPDSVTAYGHRGIVLLADGQTFAGIRDFDAALDLQPDNVPLLFRRAGAYLMNNRSLASANERATVPA